MLLTHQSYAQEVRPEISIGADLALIYPISKGQQAPFSGVLITPPAAVKLISEYTVFEDRIRLEVDTAVKIARANMNFELKEQEARCNTVNNIQKAQLDSRDKKIEILESELNSARQEVDELKSSTPSRVVWFGIGFASAMIFTIATAYTIGQVVN